MVPAQICGIDYPIGRSVSTPATIGAAATATKPAYVPHQMPAEATRGWAGELVLKLDPFSAGLLYLERLIVSSHSLTQDAALLVVPALCAVVLPAVALLAGGRLSLIPRSGA